MTIQSIKQGNSRKEMKNYFQERKCFFNNRKSLVPGYNVLG